MLTIYVDSHSSPEPGMERIHDGREEIYESGFQSVFQKSPSPEILVLVKLPGSLEFPLRIAAICGAAEYVDLLIVESELAHHLKSHHPQPITARMRKQPTQHYHTKTPSINLPSK
ncbi:hypothetical protein H0G86_010925 [Trichoderma simmonsii]|uniref:Uncharacterized protein n=1 Tax=Trichoderma simmonsii TaxID=1491479 RepID=A0A8G0LKK3_9HYPO|nr:hypothetical protein H0G86_010925 [Trichoderma simmonsii]